VAAVKEWNNANYHDWEEPEDTFIDTAKRIMSEYSEETRDQIDHIIEEAKFNFEHMED